MFSFENQIFQYYSIYKIEEVDTNHNIEKSTHVLSPSRPPQTYNFLSKITQANCQRRVFK
jgi:hypothetical protein